MARRRKFGSEPLVGTVRASGRQRLSLAARVGLRAVWGPVRQRFHEEVAGLSDAELRVLFEQGRGECERWRAGFGTEQARLLGLLGVRRFPVGTRRVASAV